jgi:hypothetical protein
MFGTDDLTYPDGLLFLGLRRFKLRDADAGLDRWNTANAGGFIVETGAGVEPHGQTTITTVQKTVSYLLESLPQELKTSFTTVPIGL